MSGHDFLINHYIHRELVCTGCGNDLQSDGEESRPRKGETLLIFPCEYCMEQAEKEGFSRGVTEGRALAEEKGPP